MSSNAFEAAYRLNGVMVDGRLRIADVDGRWIGNGTSIDGCALINITPREVTFRCHDDEVVLTLNHRTGDSGH